MEQYNHNPEPPKDDSTNKLLQSEFNFHLLFSTIVWFLEHELHTDIAMNLDVNFRQILQEN